MNIKFLATALIFGLLSCKNSETSLAENTSNFVENNPMATRETIYQFKVEDLEGNTFDFASLKGKKILVVNTASKCGLTPQYKELEALYKQYKDKNFVIVGFPANNFGQQEPGSNKEIATFCQKNYGVTFPMMAKVSVKGEDMCAMYQFLTQQSRNGLQDSQVEWNFQKYLIGTDGHLEKVVAPQVTPMDAQIVDWIKK
ncbi:glutathione peroxidase [Flavobacterium stagni]|uniref:Glutathione peroxidase n=1 Tax=Flavobacterium stagni TaxID=2506421 RepID=A0A4V1N2E4_9FLAO|nr:glutathione peroxidase [Flavobacterium stagni]